jgi:hypothetical protein
MLHSDVVHKSSILRARMRGAAAAGELRPGGKRRRTRPPTAVGCKRSGSKDPAWERKLARMRKMVEEVSCCDANCTMEQTCLWPMISGITRARGFRSTRMSMSVHSSVYLVISPPTALDVVDTRMAGPSHVVDHRYCPTSIDPLVESQHLLPAHVPVHSSTSCPRCRNVGLTTSRNRG